MAFDISKLTNAVNKYLNSISDVENAAAKAAQEIEDRTRFSVELKQAIQNNIQSRMRDDMAVPDIKGQVENQVQQATGTFDATIEQINGSFAAIRGAAESGSGNSAGNGTGDAGKNAASYDNAIAAAVSSAFGGNTSGARANRDAYSGTLSTEALQELSKSQYFSANLIQDSLFDVQSGKDSESESSNSSNSNSAFDDISLADLNTNSLLKSSLGGGSTSDLITSLAQEVTGTSGAAGTLASSNVSDYAKAIIKAYSGSAASSAATSIFGDFSL